MRELGDQFYQKWSDALPEHFGRPPNPAPRGIIHVPTPEVLVGLGNAQVKAAATVEAVRFHALEQQAGRPITWKQATTLVLAKFAEEAEREVRVTWKTVQRTSKKLRAGLTPRLPGRQTKIPTELEDNFAFII